ncbi:HET-domain-containing protein [Rhypophila decipiens]|uniref:HET-domain-containing protein n=1 Tax=Rhypophila decipiens TaxID=261697 RepID=A0AAN6Y6I1_9PEZI|nr:HET-domain-containing protein [Rhypophila decipiens]
MDRQSTTKVESPDSLQKASPSSELCTRCQQIDFWAIFNKENAIPPEHGLPVFALGQLKPDSVCPACRLFEAIRPRDYFRGRTIFVAPATYQPDVALAPFPGKALGSGVWPWNQIEVTKRGFLLCRFTDQVRPRAEEPATLLEGSHVDPSRIDYVRLKGWLQHCDSLHADTCKAKASISSLRVSLQCIDCFTRSIVDIRPGDRYLALSYVWGVPPLKIVKKGDTDRLPRHASQVIEDAMVVVRGLGEKYLWVDKYCIEQESHDIKDAQIKEMDLIYACAYATIIASAGSDANVGLPGVSKARTTYPLVVHGRELEVLPTRPPLSFAIADTAWITRGWTYQEVTLSRRCRFFTTEQVYFVCSAMDCCEAVKVGQESLFTARKPQTSGQPNKPEIPIEARRFLSLDSMSYDTSRASQLRNYAEHVAEYTGRTLTHEEDILNAFRGLLSRSPFLTYYGIPLAPYTEPSDPTLMSVKDLDMGFARGLFWTPKYKGHGAHVSISRRLGFPSWSWVGWRGRVEYCSALGPGDRARFGEGGTFMTPDSNRFDTEFWVEDVDGLLVDFQKLVSTTSQTTMMIPELSHHLAVEARVFRFRFQPTNENRFTVCVCYCHLDSSHGGIVEAFCDKWDQAIFCHRPLEANEMYHGMTSETWDCVLLFESTLQKQKNFRIVEWVGDVAYRVGVLSLRDYFKMLDSVPSSRRRIRLG